MKRLHCSTSCWLILAGLVLASPLRAQDVPTPEVALQRLKEGNARFIAGKDTKDVSAKRREETARGQYPFAIVLCCADSRLSPELIFDQGLGDIFVIRVAGNVVDPAMLGSIEYAAEHFKTPLIVVLGHDACGAVEAVLARDPAEGNLGQLLKLVHVGDKLPANKKEAENAAIKNNVLYQTAQMTAQSSVLKEFVGSKRVRIVAGVYTLKTGEITWLDLANEK